MAVSENTVATIMRELGLAARRRRRRKQTTRQGRGRWRAPDLISRDFPATTVNRKWYGDGTEIPTDEGKLYLDLVELAFAGAVLGDVGQPQMVRRLGGELPFLLGHDTHPLSGASRRHRSGVTYSCSSPCARIGRCVPDRQWVVRSQ
jgi:transposase InsO family protein